MIRSRYFHVRTASWAASDGNNRHETSRIAGPTGAQQPARGPRGKSGSHRHEHGASGLVQAGSAAPGNEAANARRRVGFRPRRACLEGLGRDGGFRAPSGTGGGISPLLRRPLPCASAVPATVPDHDCRKARTAAPPHTSLPDAVVTSLPAAPTHLGSLRVSICTRAGFLADCCATGTSIPTPLPIAFPFVTPGFFALFSKTSSLPRPWARIAPLAF